MATDDSGGSTAVYNEIDVMVSFTPGVAEEKAVAYGANGGKTMHVSYDGEVTFTVWTNASSEEWAATASYEMETTPSAFTFGTRKYDTTEGRGMFSSTLGESLWTPHAHQAAIGRFNDPGADYAFMLGNGTGDSNRSNALTVGWDGSVECGTVNGVDVTQLGGGTTYALSRDGQSIVLTGSDGTTTSVVDDDEPEPLGYADILAIVAG